MVGRVARGKTVSNMSLVIVRVWVGGGGGEGVGGVGRKKSNGNLT